MIALLLISVTVLSACGTGAAQTQEATTQQEVQQDAAAVPAAQTAIGMLNVGKVLIVATIDISGGHSAEFTEDSFYLFQEEGSDAAKLPVIGQILSKEIYVIYQYMQWSRFFRIRFPNAGSIFQSPGPIPLNASSRSAV